MSNLIPGHETRVFFNKRHCVNNTQLTEFTFQVGTVTALMSRDDLYFHNYLLTDREICTPPADSDGAADWALFGAMGHFASYRGYPPVTYSA